MEAAEEAAGVVEELAYGDTIRLRYEAGQKLPDRLMSVSRPSRTRLSTSAPLNVFDTLAMR
jgi:hypothetical protein